MLSTDSGPPTAGAKAGPSSVEVTAGLTPSSAEVTGSAGVTDDCSASCAPSGAPPRLL